MKRFFFALLLTISTSLYSQSYDAIREEFKSCLYLCQRGMMDKNRYYSFIEPFIQEAEATLVVAKYFKEHPDSALCEEYFSTLAGYNVFLFNTYAEIPIRSIISQELRVEFFKQIIEKIKNEMGGDLNSFEEFEKTTALLYKANAAYYNKLGIHSKLAIWLGKKISPFIS